MKESVFRGAEPMDRPANRPVFSPLTTVDALLRPIPSHKAPKTRRAGKYVGIFYFLWLGEHGRHKPYDISKIMAQDPMAGRSPDSPLWGEIGVYHHWGEPFYGYYYSDDEWVVRRHMRLLTEAGVDFLFFDTTNAVTYEENARLVLSVLDEYRRFGWTVPKVMFYTNTASGETVERLYRSIYAPRFCPETWFCLEGKPVIVAKPEECSPETAAFFNIRLPQWPNEPAKAGGWPWMDFERPQRVFLNSKGEPACVNVSVAQHPQLRFGDSVLYGETGNRGRAYHSGFVDGSEGKGGNDPSEEAFLSGRNVAEQFERAVEADVPVTLVTGWNEWIAGRWQGTEERPLMFVDCASPLYSRDIEMMRGGYFDHYYMQLCDYVGRLKGVEEKKSRAPGEKTVYLGFPDGDVSRVHEGYGTTYVNKTQRHAILSVTVSHTEEEITFVVETKAPVDLADPANAEGTFLSVYLQTRDEPGHSHRLRRDIPAGETVLETLDGSYRVTDERRTMNRREVSVAGTDAKCRLTLCCPRAWLGFSEGGFSFRFKVCDSESPIASVEDFYDKGDCLPTGRLDYGYWGL